MLALYRDDIQYLFYKVCVGRGCGPGEDRSGKNKEHFFMGPLYFPVSYEPLNIMLSERNQTQENYMLSDSNYMKYPEKVSQYRQYSRLFARS